MLKGLSSLAANASANGVVGVLPAPNGGTGIANGSNSSLTLSGNTPLAFVLPAAGANITLPASGSLVATDATATGNIRITGQFNSSVAQGNAPLLVASNTVVANLNVSLLQGGNWVAPNSNIGTTTAVPQANVTQLNPGGIKGRSTVANATAGNIGEYVESVVSAVNFPASGTYGDATSISLTAGDWDVTGLFQANANGATVTSLGIGISLTTGDFTTGLVNGSNWFQAMLFPVTTYNSAGSIPNWRLNVSATTTVYLKYRAEFSVATPQIYARLSARRVQPGT